MENQENVTTPGVEQPQSVPSDLSVVDLQNIRSLIEVAVRRGVFVASELSSVGQVYDKLNKFLNSIPNQTENQ
jgi:hypothetical protein